ncbi:hypothetical protein SCP_0903830 [Sparassis crispa]|uniref:Uncharacterized protein n=1 Tax=Sparassis crispa TaxID=139825 RepID=A0A401GXJ6_9APHY|nr:hypothetical protein SCP_0903830 [Sparassis crispa]GBE86504.1 hypothetical protein SCP_0903830 [Sparassis crispa]
MAKKLSFSDHPKQQTPPMPSSHPHIIGAVGGVNSLPQEEDDEDDICPVCESECTCRSRSALSRPARNSIVSPSVPSISSSVGSVVTPPPVPTAGSQSLKIKLTLPPNLKFRKHHTADHSDLGGTHTSFAPEPSDAALATNSHTASQNAARGMQDTAVKRRCRPPKRVVAARGAAKAALPASQGVTDSGIVTYVNGGQAYSQPAGGSVAPAHGSATARYNPVKRKAVSGANNKKSKGKTTTGRLPTSANVRKNLVVPPKNYSDDGFPTFISAESTSLQTTSSESSASDSELSSLDSEIESETHFLMREENARAQPRQLLGNDGPQKRREHVNGNAWEIRPRKKSVSADEDDADMDTGESSDDEDDSAGEDINDDDDDDDENVEADIEGEGLVQDADENDGRLGVSFRGVGWSDDEDEESSFDADLFFANLDGSSDSDSPSPAQHDDNASDTASDVDLGSSLSVDEEDALRLMDIDPTVSFRRSNGEFEFGLGLDNLSFGWDGQVLFTNSRPQSAMDIGFGVGPPDGDVEMLPLVENSRRYDEDESTTADKILLEESDGETTEDELVDSDGLPNPRAMMLFRWPSTVSAIDPLSTLGQTPSTPPRAPPNASESMRIALASFSAHQSSPAPTPADILTAKISMDDLDEIEMDKGRKSSKTARRSAPVPIMGEFVAAAENLQACAVIDGKGGIVPSPFPRSKQSSRRCDAREQGSNELGPDTANALVDSIHSSVHSSDENMSQSQLQSSELSSTDVIDLDDVLDSSFLDSDVDDCDLPLEQLTSTEGSVGGNHIQSLSRWDRIPMATFRRTRETVVGSVINDAPSSDTGLGAYGGMSTMIGGAMLTNTRASDKKSPTSCSSRKRSKAKGTNGAMLPPFPFPLSRDGDRTPTSSSPRMSHSSLNHTHSNKTKKELRREKAMLKRKMMSKPLPPRQQHLYRAHHANYKSRSSSSMQRTGHFAGSNTSPCSV